MARAMRRRPKRGEPLRGTWPASSTTHERSQLVGGRVRSRRLACMRVRIEAMVGTRPWTARSTRVRCNCSSAPLVLRRRSRMPRTTQVERFVVGHDDGSPGARHLAFDAVGPDAAEGGSLQGLVLTRRRGWRRLDAWWSMTATTPALFAGRYRTAASPTSLCSCRLGDRQGGRFWTIVGTAAGQQVALGRCYRFCPHGKRGADASAPRGARELAAPHGVW